MKPGKDRHAWRRRTALACLAFFLALAASYRVEAAYVRRYCTVVNGGITFTGNAIGLDKASGGNSPGTAGSIGTFITTNTGVRETSSWPWGTTASWTANSSSAVLRLPAGSTVLYAELIWSGSYNYGGELTNPADLDSPVDLSTPLGGPYAVAPDPVTSRTISVSGSNTHNYYVRSQDVTNWVRAAGAGTYTVGRVPGTQANSENNNNYAGWTLAVVYEDQSQPSRSITFFVGGELAYLTNPTTISIVDGFRTAQTGPVNGRLLVVAGEGDANITGDQIYFGETVDAMGAVSGTNNPQTNFFASQINGDSGSLDTSGTFGNRNHTRSSPTSQTFTLSSGARQGYDITNVDISPLLRNNQTSAVVQGSTNGDTYFMIAVGLQVDIGAPKFRRDVKRADRSIAAVGEVITYTVDLDNTQGTADAVNIEFEDDLPWGLEFVPDSLTIGGVPQPGANPEHGVYLDRVRLGQTVTLTYRARVTAVPVPPAAAEYRNTASWTHQFQSAPVLPLHNGQVTTDPSVVTVPQLTLSKTVSANGNTLTYTITATNTSAAATAGTTLVDPIPAGTTYQAGSTTLNGTTVPDAGGTMPFATPRAINSNGAGSGVIAAGASATVVFRVTRTAPTVTNTATVDPDGGGLMPPINASVTYPVNPQANLGVTLTDNQTSAVAGTALSYLATVTNAAGSAAVTSCGLTLALPPGLSQVVYTPASGSYDQHTGQWTGLNLTAGGSVTMTIAGTLSPDATGSITATANLSPPSGTTDPNLANNNATDIDAVANVADLSVAKTDGSDYATRGEAIDYAITVTNNGPSTLTSLFVTDLAPAAILNPVFATMVGLYNPDTHLLSGLHLGPGESAVLTLSGTVADTATGTIVNTVTVSPPADAADPNATNNQATDTDTILTNVPSFNLNAKSANRTSTTVGDTITYTVNLSNTGTGDAINIEFKDEMPWGLVFVANSLTIGGVAQPGANPETGVSIARVNQGQTVVLTYQAYVAAVPLAPAVAEYRNTAAWTYQYEPAPGQPLRNGEAITNPAVVTVPRLTVSKSVVASGGNRTLTYTIRVSNDGTAATSGTTLYDPIPALSSYRTGTTTLNGNAVNDNPGGIMPFSVTPHRAINSVGDGPGIIAAGEAAVVVFQVRRNQGATVTNRVYVDPDGGGPLPPVSDQATYPTDSIPHADLGVTLTDGLDSAVAGAPLTYNVTVSSASGSDDVNGFVLALALPAELADAVFTPAAGAYDVNTGRWTGLNLAAGGSVSMTIAGILSPGAAGSITATATLSHLPETETTDPTPANNSATDTDTVTIQADLSVAKTDGRTTVGRGDAVTYTITVTNAGPSALTSLYVIDTVPAALLNPVFAVQEGLYNPVTHLLSGLHLNPGASAVLTLSGTVSGSAGGTLENVVNVAPPLDVADPDMANNMASDVDTVLSLAVSGYVYEDADHDAAKDWGETGPGLAGLYVKLVPSSGGDALQAVQVDVSTGAYQCVNVAEGTYTLVLDDNATLTDTLPSVPAGWVGTEAPAQSRGPLFVSSGSISGQNFGLWHGGKVGGVVFRDDGAGGGTANDGVRNGGEAALAGVRVWAADGTRTLATAITNGGGGYELWIAAGDAGPIHVVENNPGGYLSVGGSAGDTGGNYDRTQDRTAFTCMAGVAYTGVDFADVPASTISPGAVKEVMAGAAAFFPHVFTAGTSGTVSVGVTSTASPSTPSWTAVIYLDADGDGQLDPGETELTQSRTAAAGERIYLLIKVYAPAGAPPGARAQIAVAADFALTGASPPLSLSMAAADLAVMVAPPTAGLSLSKSADKQYARPGETITYTIAYANQSGSPLSTLVITDATPVYTTFLAAGHGPLPLDLTLCSITAPPPGESGTISWVFTGSLAPGATGFVTYQVLLSQ
ncbi:MAG: hypothetical protein ACM3ZC_06330 [Bacteroidota bacterium]